MATDTFQQMESTVQLPQIDNDEVTIFYNVDNSTLAGQFEEIAAISCIITWTLDVNVHIPHANSVRPW
ncbi:hypothetical protein AX16_000931 [Volvariella volvacea WC 439]|nr:hypothetical protein AX16_000931 [Volvariella volvacea WC 439]